MFLFTDVWKLLISDLFIRLFIVCNEFSHYVFEWIPKIYSTHA